MSLIKVKSTSIDGSLGITMADHWYKNSNSTGNQNPISGWARMANTAQGGINAGMTESHVHDVMITKEAPNYQRS